MNNFGSLTLRIYNSPTPQRSSIIHSSLAKRLHFSLKFTPCEEFDL